MALKWGIITAGRISHDFVNALRTLPADEHDVLCVAARRLDDAKKFADLHSIAIAYEGYEAVAKNNSVEVVYIGALHPAHFELGVMMLEHGKHVLCEKPLCMNEKQSKKLLDLAKSKNLFFMEAIWSRFFPSYQYLRSQIEAGALGDIEEIKVDFCFNLQKSPRTVHKELGGGCTLDQGIYAIQLSLWVFKDYPVSIEATGELNEEGCDQEVTATLKFPNGGVSNIFISCKKDTDSKAIIKGSKGTIVINQFWSPTALIDVDGSEKSWPLPAAEHNFFYPSSCGLRYETDATRQCIRSGLIECETVSHSESLRIARIEDEIRRQLGVTYPADFE